MILFPVAFALMFQTQEALAAVCGGGKVVDTSVLRGDPICGGGAAPVVVSGVNVYTAWTNFSSTLHTVPVLFAKSNDGGKTFANTMIISTPNTNPKTVVINQNVSIGASGNNVAVTWWTNKTGIFNPVIRTSSDGGNTFASIVRLNSTSGGINK
jgi:hypothetical protein